MAQKLPVWNIDCVITDRLTDLYTHWDWEGPHCSFLLILILGCNTSVSMMSLELNVQCYCWHESIVYLLLYSCHATLFAFLGASCTVEQWWQKAYTFNTQLDHQLLRPLPQSILSMFLYMLQKYWEWQSDDLDNKQDVPRVIGIIEVYHYTWSTYHSCHYCIDAIKQYTCVAKKYRLLYIATWSTRIYLQAMCCIIISV